MVNSVAYRNGVEVGYQSLQARSFLSRWMDVFGGWSNKEEGSFGDRKGGHDLTTRAHAHSHSLHSVLVRRRVRRQSWFGTTRADRHLYPCNRPRPMSMQGMPETIHSNYSSPSLFSGCCRCCVGVGFQHIRAGACPSTQLVEICTQPTALKGNRNPSRLAPNSRISFLEDIQITTTRKGTRKPSVLSLYQRRRRLISSTLPQLPLLTNKSPHPRLPLNLLPKHIPPCTLPSRGGPPPRRRPTVPVRQLDTHVSLRLVIRPPRSNTARQRRPNPLRPALPHPIPGARHPLSHHPLRPKYRHPPPLPPRHHTHRAQQHQHRHHHHRHGNRHRVRSIPARSRHLGRSRRDEHPRADPHRDVTIFDRGPIVVLQGKVDGETGRVARPRGKEVGGDRPGIEALGGGDGSRGEAGARWTRVVDEEGEGEGWRGEVGWGPSYFSQESRSVDNVCLRREGV